jgi:hypothetical protein
MSPSAVNGLLIAIKRYPEARYYLAVNLIGLLPIHHKPSSHYAHAHAFWRTPRRSDVEHRCTLIERRAAAPLGRMERAAQGPVRFLGASQETNNVPTMLPACRSFWSRSRSASTPLRRRDALSDRADSGPSSFPRGRRAFRRIVPPAKMIPAICRLASWSVVGTSVRVVYRFLNPRSPQSEHGRRRRARSCESKIEHWPSDDRSAHYAASQRDDWWANARVCASQRQR